MLTSDLALIVASSDSLRYSLQALLARLPQIADARSLADLDILLAALPNLQPRLIMLDVNLLRENNGVELGQIKVAAHHARLVVLVDRIEQQQALQNAGADLVLLKGYPAADLFARLERLLAHVDPDEH